MSQTRFPVIVTRAEPGASETAIWLEGEGYQPILSPALSLKAIEPKPALQMDGLQALIFTSANGVRYLCKTRETPAITAWCVGETTKAAALEAGFKTVRSGTGDAVSLADMICKEAVPGDGGFLHVGNVAAGERLVNHLQEGGFEARFAALYESLFARELTEETRHLLATGEPCAILVHSAKGAASFARLTKDHELTSAVLVAISAQAAAPLEQAGFAKTVIAECPDRVGMSQALAEGLRAL